jgi:elongation factor G
LSANIVGYEKTSVIFGLERAMPRFSTSSIRNLCVVGNTGVGKTSLVEALLKHSGAIAVAGSVEKGTTVSDFDTQEKARLHSLNTSVISFDASAIHFNVIDTPGLADFRGTTLSAMAAVETVAVVLNAQAGLDANALKLLERAKARGNERVIILNRIDADGVKLEAVMAQLTDTLGPICLPLNLPSRGMTRVVDCFFTTDSKFGTEISSVKVAHQQIIDQVVEVNPAVMEHYLEEGEAKLSTAELHDAFEQCLREGHLIPVLFTSARTGAGIAELFDVLVRLLPNPAEGNPPPFFKSVAGSDAGNMPPSAHLDATKSVERAVSVQIQADPLQHVVAHVFKVVNDPFVGKLCVFRIYQGTVKRDTQLYIGDGKKPFKVGHLYKLFGAKHGEIEEGIAGDICAVAKIDDIHYGDVLHDSHDEDHWHLMPLALPKAMFGLSVQPISRGHEQKLSSALQKLSEEDPSFHIEHHVELNETVLRGLGDLHLKVMLERLKARFQVEVKTAPPRIAYRETISLEAEGHHRHKKQTGGAGQFGEVSLRVRPLARGEGFRFIDATRGGTIPHNFMPAVEKGVRMVLEHGAIAGFPLQDLEVSAFDGKHHPVDSKEVAFISAGKFALLDAISKAGALVLEPIVELSVTLPDASMGHVSTGLSSKRARVTGTDAGAPGELIMRAHVPMSELRDYQSELKSQTAGLASYTIDFSHYEPVPGLVQKQLVDAYKPKFEED